MTKAIEVRNLNFKYSNGTEALRDISFSIDKGSKTALLGPNGSGKSTLIMHLNGIILPQRGKVIIDGKEVNKKTEQEIKKKVGVVFQDPDDQVFSTTVWEDVAFGPINMGMTEEIVREKVEKALKLVGMWQLKDRMPYHLSYGQKKRVALAGILAMDSDIIVLDEPGAYLDPRGKQDLFEILNELHGNKKTLVIATHDINLVAEWADRIIILKEGQLLREGDRNLLLEEEILIQANLTLPIVSSIFLQACYQRSKVPVTVEEAVNILKRVMR
ncbi:MAG: cobalt/nickel transport system ATP-binding protein [Halanaerobiales bacterium]|nr:cobalt/nickel transport system ATP-binding protein [Halanaerobiales bacterium]